MSNHLTPLDVCERLIGPPQSLALICGLHAKSVFPWKRASKWREAGDVPSTHLQRRLQNHSNIHALGLTALHLIWGADEGEIAAILAARAPAGAVSAPVPALKSTRRAAA